MSKISRRGIASRGTAIAIVFSMACFLAGTSSIALAQGAPAQVQSAGQVSGQGSFQKLEDVLQYAYVNSPTLRAARAELRARDELLPQARSNWLPTADARAGLTKAWIDSGSPQGDGTTSKELEAGFSQPLYRGGRTIAATDSAMGRIYAQRALLLSVEQSMLLDVARSYMDVFRAEALLQLVRSNQSKIDQQMIASRERFDAGEATRTDVAQAEARLARARADVTRAEGEVKKSRAVFEQLSGLRAGSMGYPRLNLPLPASADDTMALAEENHPLVHVSRYFHEAAEHDIDVVFGELLPRLAFNGNYIKQYNPQPGFIDEYEAKMVSLTATIPLYEGGATRSRVRQAKHTANERYLEILEARRNVREDAARAWENMIAARAEIRSRHTQVESAAVAREGVRQETLMGMRTILDSLDADQEYLEAQVALITAQRDEIVSQFSILAAIGRMTPETLGFGGFTHDSEANFKNVEWKMLGMDAEIDQGGS